MSYDVEIIEAADGILAMRKSQAEAIRDSHIMEISSIVKGYSALQSKLAETMVDAVKALGMGKNAESFMKEVAEKNLAIQAEMNELIVKAGYPKDYTQAPYTCKECCDSGFIGANPCFCRTALIKELAIEKFNKSTPSQKFTFDNFKLDFYPNTKNDSESRTARDRMKDVYNYCIDYADDFDLESGNLYLFGATGLGKTHLAVAIAGKVVEHGYKVIYDSASNILRGIEKEHFASSKDDRFEGTFDEYINCDLLVIDDLGSEFSTQFTVAAIYDLINTRINKSLPTIISSNLSTFDLEKKYTERIASRIIGNYVNIAFYGNDIRQIKRKF